MIHFHGGPVTPTTAAIALWTRRHALVSFERQDQTALTALGITDMGEIVARLEAHLATIRARVSSMFAEPYPQQPGGAE